MNRVDVREVIGGVTLTSGVETAILGPVNLLRYPNKAITIYNLGPITISGIVVQTNPDPRGNEAGTSNAQGSAAAGPNAGLWHTYDATTFQNLGSGTVKTLEIANSAARWWRVIGLNDNKPGTQNITVSGYLYAQTI